MKNRAVRGRKEERERERGGREGEREFRVQTLLFGLAVSTEKLAFTSSKERTPKRRERERKTEREMNETFLPCSKRVRDKRKRSRHLKRERERKRKRGGQRKERKIKSEEQRDGRESW